MLDNELRTCVLKHEMNTQHTYTDTQTLIHSFAQSQTYIKCYVDVDAIAANGAEFCTFFFALSVSFSWCKVKSEAIDS